MKLEDHIRALITQYQKLQKRHQFHAQNAYYQFQSDMWQAMADDFGIIVEDLQQALYCADDVKPPEQPEPKNQDDWHKLNTTTAGKFVGQEVAKRG